MAKLCFWMFLLKTDLYMGLFFFSIFNTDDRAHLYLPHPTLPNSDVKGFSRATERCWLKHLNGSLVQFGKTWSRSRRVEFFFAKVAEFVSEGNTLQTVMGLRSTSGSPDVVVSRLINENKCGNNTLLCDACLILVMLCVKLLWCIK